MKKNPLAEGRRWFQQGDYELRVAHNLVNNAFHAAACFFAHQAAEKFLKALLYSQGERRVVGHSISDLCDKCAEYFETFTQLKARVKQLDLYYIPTRYPNGLPGGVPAEMYDEADSATALKQMIKIRTAVIQVAPNLATKTSYNAENDQLDLDQLDMDD
jgi:HEPN domain-containing protein